MAAYYNEIDPYAAQWLRNLVSAGHIAPGDVDERSIVDVRGDDLRGYTQCHFFAGIGGWSYALRLAGWPDDRPVWTGSCPCQPFSVAGKQGGFADERHLWPEFYRLIDQRRPTTVFGEQVTGGAGLRWLDVVSNDMERNGYSFGTSVLPALCVGAPHRRPRSWFVANARGDEQPRQEPCRRPPRRMGAGGEFLPWQGGWEAALAKFRVMDDGVPRCVARTDAARNAIVPQVAAKFITAFMETQS